MNDHRLHWCASPGCGQLGNYGYAVGKDKPLIWTCRAHRDLGQARLAPAVPGPGLGDGGRAGVSPPAGPRGQGRLL